jgi:hypothetical protein
MKSKDCYQKIQREDLSEEQMRVKEGRKWITKIVYIIEKFKAVKWGR